MSTHREKNGFTFIELLIVVAILAVLATITVPFAEFTFIREKEDELQLALKDIRGAINRWRGDCEKMIVERYSINVFITVPEPLLYPPDIGSLAQPLPQPHTVMMNGVTPITFYPKKYLSHIPVDPFVGGAAWTQHYASCASNLPTTTWRQGKISWDILNPLDNASGVFDVSPIASASERHGFVTSLNGTSYKDW